MTLLQSAVVVERPMSTEPVGVHDEHCVGFPGIGVLAEDPCFVTERAVERYRVTRDPRPVDRPGNVADAGELHETLPDANLCNRGCSASSMTQTIVHRAEALS